MDFSAKALDSVSRNGFRYHNRVGKRVEPLHKRFIIAVEMKMAADLRLCMVSGQISEFIEQS